MPGPGFTSPNNRDSKRSEALRQVLRERYGDYGGNRRDLKNRHNRKPKLKDGVDRQPYPWGQRNGGRGNGPPPPEKGGYGPHWGWRA